MYTFLLRYFCMAETSGIFLDTLLMTLFLVCPRLAVQRPVAYGNPTIICGKQFVNQSDAA